MNLVELRDLCNKLIADGVDEKIAICEVYDAGEGVKYFSEICGVHLFAGNYFSPTKTSMIDQHRGHFLLIASIDDLVQCIDDSDLPGTHVRQLSGN